jgi:hypothetical protein
LQLAAPLAKDTPPYSQLTAGGRAATCGAVVLHALRAAIQSPLSHVYVRPYWQEAVLSGYITRSLKQGRPAVVHPPRASKAGTARIRQVVRRSSSLPPALRLLTIDAAARVPPLFARAEIRP